jgi:tripartite-type tricarboxylate transporter receptor subunit TctC
MNAARIAVGIAALLTLSALGGWFTPQAFAQSYPSAPIHIIVPFAAGGLVDALSRALGARVSESVGQPVIVENRPGADHLSFPW